MVNRQLGEDSDSDFRDSCSEGSTDSETERGFNSLSFLDRHGGVQEDFSSDDGESGNSQDFLLFEYLERDPPYSRVPLADKASIFCLS